MLLLHSLSRSSYSQWPSWSSVRLLASVSSDACAFDTDRYCCLGGMQHMAVAAAATAAWVVAAACMVVGRLSITATRYCCVCVCVAAARCGVSRGCEGRGAAWPGPRQAAGGHAADAGGVPQRWVRVQSGGMHHWECCWLVARPHTPTLSLLLVWNATRDRATHAAVLSTPCLSAPEQHCNAAAAPPPTHPLLLLQTLACLARCQSSRPWPSQTS